MCDSQVNQRVQVHQGQQGELNLCESLCEILINSVLHVYVFVS